MAQEHDIKPHLDTWNGFTRLMAMCLVGTVIVLVLLAAFVV